MTPYGSLGVRRAAPSAPNNAGAQGAHAETLQLFRGVGRSPTANAPLPRLLPIARAAALYAGTPQDRASANVFSLREAR